MITMHLGFTFEYDACAEDNRTSPDYLPDERWQQEVGGAPGVSSGACGGGWQNDNGLVEATLNSTLYEF